MMQTMWTRVILTAVIWAAVSTAVPAASSYSADTQLKANRLFERGRYLEAAALAKKARTAAGFALAARATLAHAIYVAKRAQRQVQVETGVELAEKALALDSRQVEAHLQLVIAFYQKSRATTPLDAYFQGYADKSSEHLAIALNLEPDNPWGLWLLGGWNFEVVRLAGPILADTLFSASLAAGRAAFTRAISLMPGSVVLQYSFARALLMDDPDTNRKEAIQLLKKALVAKRNDFLDGIIASRARAVMDAVKVNSPDALRHALRPDG
jgi:tetratricopeptide (TPR) repeat protein